MIGLRERAVGAGAQRLSLKPFAAGRESGNVDMLRQAPERLFEFVGNHKLAWWRRATGRQA